MARYSHKGHDTIRSESACPYVRTARPYSSKQATAHNTGAPPFCLSTLSPLQVPGYWTTGEATVGGRPVSLKSRVIQQGYCEYWPPNNSNCYCLAAAQHGRLAASWPAGGRTTQIFSDCAITNYLSCATAFTVNPPDRPGNYCQLVSLCLLLPHCTRLPLSMSRTADGIYRH